MGESEEQKKKKALDKFCEACRKAGRDDCKNCTKDVKIGG
jgi:hypothetical protein